MKPAPLHLRSLPAFACLAALLCTAPSFAQDRLKSMPGYERYQQVGTKIPSGGARGGAISVRWIDGGKQVEFLKDDKRWRYDFAAQATVEAPKDGGPKDAASRERGPRRERGRQFALARSPDERFEAVHHDRDLFLKELASGVELPVTTDGDEQKRVKSGTASWVYGEELDQITAMWWSPDSAKLAYYRFDESGVPDYYLQLAQTEVQSKLDVEAYPKAGAPNPVAEIHVYDLASKQTVNIDVRGGKPFADDVLGHYAYNVAWSPDGRELLFNRTNRRQNVMEFCAADPATGACRVIVREEWLPSWTENSPERRFLEDGRRFVWASERTGWRNYYLYELGGKLLATLTRHEFECGDIVRVDEAGGHLDYLAHSGDNPLKQQLHRVALDGTGDVRLTDPALHHSVDVAPDGRHFVDVAQAHDVPPVTRLLDAEGKLVIEIGRADTKAIDQLGLKRVELLQFKAADGETVLYGMLHFPSDFDPAKKYPLLVPVYAGPGSRAGKETFTLPNPLTEYGFLVATFDARSAGGRGKRFMDAIYQKLGTVEVDDLAAGVRSLRERAYVDPSRVGIYGTSYGGYASVMCLLRHPDAFRAACASSPVTDWVHYDTIYTERYMRTPRENPEGYTAGSAMTYAKDLAGRLMLFYGTADNNVHPNNTMQLVKALQKAGKSFDLQVGPDRGHSAISEDRMMEFFIENLVLPGG